MRNDIAAVFEEAGADGFLHASTLAGDREVAHHADELVVTASVFKIPVLLELCAQAAEGRVSLTDRVTVTPDQRVMGPTGLSVLLDPVDLSLRDLATGMMSVSDNTATDVLMDLVGGAEVINRRLGELGLERTHLIGDCGDLLGELVSSAALQPGETGDDVGSERLARAAALDPAMTSRTTPRQMSDLLRLIWSDAAAPPEACAEVRRIMALQVWPHRLRSGFPSEVRLAAKTGTLFYWRNEAGIATYRDGSSYAVSVFTRAHSPTDVQPKVDASIGKAARLAVESLRR